MVQRAGLPATVQMLPGCSPVARLAFAGYCLGGAESEKVWARWFQEQPGHTSTT